MPYTAMQQLDLIKANKIKLINKLNTLLGTDSGLTWDSPWADILDVIRSIKTLLPEENLEVINEIEKFLANNSIGEVTINSDEIVPYAFYQKNTITSLIGPNVKTVGTQAFYNDSQLVSINLPIAETVKTAAFYNTKLSELNLPNVTLIEDKGFQSNTALTSINLPKLTRTNVEAFRDCSALSSVDIPNLTYISAHSFQNTKIKLKDISITNLTYLGSYAMASCSKLNEELDSIEILPQNNLTIDTYCFQNANLSKDVFVGNKVTSIGGYAFLNCGSNTKFWCEAPSKPSGWDSNWNSSNYPVNWGCVEKEYTFVKNNGEEDLVITKRYLTNDDFPVVERDGYQLDSWYTDEAFTHEISTPYYSKVNSTRSTTIYARWIRGFNLKAINIEDNFSETDLGTYYFNNISDFKNNINGFNCVGYYENYNNQIFSNVVSDLDSISGLVPTLYIKATYLITKTEVHDFDYTGAVAEMVAEPGEHKLECWGAQGGDNTSSGGRGGYSVGTLTVTGQNANLYVYVGGAGSKSATASGGGFNGGTGTNYYGGCGGGASDVRLGADSLYSRLIVAGGGGGAGHASTIGGAGGGSAGLDGGAGSTIPGRGGKQISGGTAANSSLYGKFGLGGTNNSNGGGAGGGWYGGGHGNGSGTDSGGGGGSGWVYTEDSYENWANNSTEGQSGNWQLSNTDYLTEASTSAGDVEFLSPDGVNEIGHSGNGYIRITSTIKGEQESDFHGCTVNLTGIINNEMVNLDSITLMHNLPVANLSTEFGSYINQTGEWYYDEECQEPIQDILEISTSSTSITIYCNVIEVVEYDFMYTGSVQSITLLPARYKLECWGAQGGDDPAYPTSVFGGRGGYSTGVLNITQNTTLYLHVGGRGTGSTLSTWNSTGGGGATDISLYASESDWNNAQHFYSRIIVAGGGGGVHGKNHLGVARVYNDGGGLVSPTFTGQGTTITGSSQVAGGQSTYNSSWYPGEFGFAKDTGQTNTYSAGGWNGGSRGSDGWANGGAGGGWYGGCVSWPCGAGGSGWVYTAESYDNWAQNSSEGQSGQWLLDSTYYLTEAETIAGNQEFLAPDGSTEIGHAGDGYIRITKIS